MTKADGRIFRCEVCGDDDTCTKDEHVCPDCRADAAQVRDLTARLAAAEALADRLGEALEKAAMLLEWEADKESADTAIAEWKKARDGK